MTADRVLFDVEDECGGLPAGKVEELFAPYTQRGRDRSGVGLGLSICLKAARANRGEVGVRDLPGKGCVFTLDLPRRPGTAATGVGGSAPELPDAKGGSNTVRTVRSHLGEFPVGNDGGTSSGG